MNCVLTVHSLCVCYLLAVGGGCDHRGCSHGREAALLYTMDPAYHPRRGTQAGSVALQRSGDILWNCTVQQRYGSLCARAPMAVGDVDAVRGPVQCLPTSGCSSLRGRRSWTSWCCCWNAIDNWPLRCDSVVTRECIARASWLLQFAGVFPSCNLCEWTNRAKRCEHSNLRARASRHMIKQR